MVDVETPLAWGFFLFLGIGGGIYVGARLALNMAGEFVEDTLVASKVLALELLNNPQMRALADGAKNFKGFGDSPIIKFGKRLLGM